MSKKEQPSLKGKRSGTEPMLLSELISAVKSDLIQSAQTRGEGFEALFQIDQVVIDTEITAERKIGAKGSASFLVATVGADSTQTNATKHKVSVVLTPADVESKALLRGPK